MEVPGEAVVAGGDPAEVLEPAKHAFDRVAVSVKVWRETVFPDPIGFRRDVGGRAHGFDLPTDGVAVVTLVAVDEFGSRYLIK